MKNEIKYVLSLIGIGVLLISYAHANFVTKDLMVLIIDRLNRIESKIDNSLGMVKPLEIEIEHIKKRLDK